MNVTANYDQIASFENLLQSWRTAALGKRSRSDVATFEYYLEWHLIQLRDQLQAETYRPGHYRHFTIADPKPRYISAAPFRDRVVHHALCNVIEPLFERRFIKDSYASRAGKGIHGALDRCTHFARRFRYVLQCDIVQFFPSVDLAILRHILAREIADQRIVKLCNRIIDGGAHELTDHYSLVVYPGDSAYGAAHRQRGLPVGNQTSQFWANCYMDRLDHYITDDLGCRGYVRYVDDFILFSDDKALLHRWRLAIIAYLAKHLRLIIHEPESTVNPVTEGIPFLGFRVYPDYRRLRRRNGVRFVQRLRAMGDAYRNGDMSQDDVQRRVRGWVAHVQHGDTYRLRRSLLRLGNFQRTKASQV